MNSPEASLQPLGRQTAEGQRDHRRDRELLGEAAQALAAAATRASPSRA
ncbi:MAG: hypothetical protein QM796_17305 [Chthoniobacteraceae bacterium]